MADATTPKTPLSPKVLAALAGSGAGAALGTALVWLLGAALWHGGWDADSTAHAIASVPTPVSALIPITLAVLAAWGSGWAVEDPLRTLGAAVQASTSNSLGAVYDDSWDAWEPAEALPEAVAPEPAPLEDDDADTQPEEPKLS